MIHFKFCQQHCNVLKPKTGIRIPDKKYLNEEATASNSIKISPFQHIFMELCFWKNSREAVEIMEGYGTQSASSKQKASYWCEEDEEKLARVFRQVGGQHFFFWGRGRSATPCASPLP
jgi:hypothetical protein